MNKRLLYLSLAFALLLLAFFADLALGATSSSPGQIVAAIFDFDDTNYAHFVIVFQRLPRAGIAIYVGAMMAVGGYVLQGLIRNPLASPATLGINSGASLFVVAGAYLFQVSSEAQGILALLGAVVGLAACVVVARMTGLLKDPRGLALILSGALVSMLLTGISNAFLLSDPARRNDFLAWITGDINHVYAERLYAFWWIGALAFVLLLVLARPMSLLMLGAEKASSAGVNVRLTSRLAFLGVLLGCGSAVAICGPVGFVGLIVPHIVRPLAGSNFSFGLPASAALGATICLLADILARLAFQPYVLHTGVIMDLLGGVVFALIVKRFYLGTKAGVNT